MKHKVNVISNTVEVEYDLQQNVTDSEEGPTRTV